MGYFYTGTIRNPGIPIILDIHSKSITPYAITAPSHLENESSSSNDTNKSYNGTNDATLAEERNSSGTVSSVGSSHTGAAENGGQARG